MNLKILLVLVTAIAPFTVFGDEGNAKKASTMTIPAFYSSRSPVELLEDLTTLHALNPQLNGKINLPNLDQSAIQSWLTDGQLRELIKLAKDETPCLQAVNVLSSFRSEGPSTVGQEALRMIQGALRGAYPPNAARSLERDQIEAMLASFLERKIELQK